MSFRFPNAVSLRWMALLAAIPLSGDAAAATSRVVRQLSPATLRVCADPNNLPFSNRQQEGFENKIAELLAHEMKARLEYTWWAQRRGFLRNTLKAGRCDVVMGMPTTFDAALTTEPYYRSSYVFVSRKDGPADIRSLNDPELHRLRIGVQIVGDDLANTPPAHALASRGIVANVRGFTVYGDYSRPNPPARIVDAVVRGEIDVAIVWGPLAGYFAPRQPALRIVPVSPAAEGVLPFTFDIGIGVRRDDRPLQQALQKVMARKRRDIDAILRNYRVPRLDIHT